MGIGDVRELTDNIAGWVILAGNVLSALYDIHNSDQRTNAGGRIRTPNEASKMEPGAQVKTAHPSSLVFFQTTWVKCE